MIRLQFATEVGIASALIRWFGGIGRFSHVDAMVEECGVVMFLGARKDGGVMMRVPGYAPFTRKASVSITATPSQEAEFNRLLRSQLGKPYSWKTILGFAVGRDLGEKAGWDCSTLVAWALVNAGVLPREFFGFLRRISPDDLYLAALVAAHAGAPRAA